MQMEWRNSHGEWARVYSVPAIVYDAIVLTL
jgi:hypothetical protein